MRKTTVIKSAKARISGPTILLGSLRRWSAPFAFMRNASGHLLGARAVISHIALTFRTESTLMLSAVINLWRHKQPSDRRVLVLPDSAPFCLRKADLPRLIWDFTYD